MAYYKSIGCDLHRMVVHENRSFRGVVTNQDFMDVARLWSETIQNDKFYQFLARPDFTIYIIDFKIWEYYFAMNTCENWVPFSPVDPRGKIDKADLNPFPVIHYTPSPSAVPVGQAPGGKVVDAKAQAHGPSTNGQLPSYHHGLSIDEIELLARAEVNRRLRQGIPVRSGHFV